MEYSLTDKFLSFHSYKGWASEEDIFGVMNYSVQN